MLHMYMIMFLGSFTFNTILMYIYIIIIGSQFSRKHHMSQVLWLYVQIILSSISKPEATCSELVLEIPQ
jgi:hypothetical protein